MKLLFDFRAYQEFYPRGVSRYVYELFTRAIDINDGLNGVLVDFGKRLPDFPSNLAKNVELYDLEKFVRGEVNEEFDVFINGSTTWLGRQTYDSIDILYPKSVLEKCKRKVCILYDFVPLLYSHYLPTDRDQINYFLQCEAMKYMDHIFTISKYVSSSGARYLQRPLEDFTCLYGGADYKKFHTENSDKEYDTLKRNNNLVNVSGICVRKNFEGVTEAFCKAYKSGELPLNAKLLIVCSSSEYFVEAIKKKMEKYGLKYGKHVIATGFLPDSEMVKIVSNARCSIYPSYYEGLGLPILESYTAGTPCIASNVSSTKEFVLKEMAFNPFDTDDISNKIIQIYKDEQLCRKSLEFGRTLIKKINWEMSANTLINKLKEM